MAIRKLFVSVDNDDYTLEADVSTGGDCVAVEIATVDKDRRMGSSVILLNPDDIEDLCAELARFAKLAKQGGRDGKA